MKRFLTICVGGCALAAASLSTAAAKLTKERVYATPFEFVIEISSSSDLWGSYQAENGEEPRRWTKLPEAAVFVRSKDGDQKVVLAPHNIDGFWKTWPPGAVELWSDGRIVGTVQLPVAAEADHEADLRKRRAIFRVRRDKITSLGEFFGVSVGEALRFPVELSKAEAAGKEHGGFLVDDGGSLEDALQAIPEYLRDKTMRVAPSKVEGKLEVTPVGEQADDLPNPIDPLVIKVRAEGQLHVDDQEMDKDKLHGHLKEYVKICEMVGEKPRVTVVPEAGSKLDYLSKVLGICKRAGVEFEVVVRPRAALLQPHVRRQKIK